MATSRRWALVASQSLRHAAHYWTLLLLEFGYEVRIARDGDEVRRLISLHGVPQLLVSDVWLPRVDGLALVRHLRREISTDRMSVVMFSAQEPLREMARQLADPLGISQILAADADRSTVRDAIRAAQPHTGEGNPVPSPAPIQPQKPAPVSRNPDATLDEPEPQRPVDIETLRRFAMTDPLTGLLNRRAGQESCDREIARAKRSKEPVCLILLDIDHFKKINDSYGHPAGDKVLRELGALLHPPYHRTGTLREYDIVARWGGEEFLIFVSADLEQARRVAERIRLAVEMLRVEGVRPFTVSGGVSENNADYDFDRMFEKADRRLYRAKKAGRNCIVAVDSASLGGA